MSRLLLWYILSRVFIVNMWCLSSRDGKKCPEGAPRSFRVNYPFWPTSSILKTQYMPRYALIVAFPDEGTAVRSVFLHEDVEDSGLRTIYPPIILDPLGYSSLDHQYLQQYMCMYIIYREGDRYIFILA